MPRILRLCCSNFCPPPLRPQRIQAAGIARRRNVPLVFQGKCSGSSEI